MYWTWDVGKNAANLQRHGISFEIAILALNDPYSVSVLDTSSYEERWQTYGTIGANVFVVIHTGSIVEVESGTVGRIISARRATRHERDKYEETSF